MAARIRRHVASKSREVRCFRGSEVASGATGDSTSLPHSDSRPLHDRRAVFAARMDRRTQGRSSGVMRNRLQSVALTGDVGRSLVAGRFSAC